MIRPKQIITANSLKNAIRVDMALGGSTNTVLHLHGNRAARPEIPLSLADFSRIGEEIPHLVHMQPSGPHSMQVLYRSGGIPAVLKRIEAHLDDSMTVSGRTVQGDRPRCRDPRSLGDQGR